MFWSVNKIKPEQMVCGILIIIVSSRILLLCNLGDESSAPCLPYSLLHGLVSL